MDHGEGKLEITPCFIKEANAFVSRHHRHHKPAHHALFALAVSVNGEAVGVAIVSPTTARLANDGWTAEVKRLCVKDDAPKGAASKRLSACWRAARALGWMRLLITYTLPEEGGASLRGAGWKLVNTAAGGGRHTRKDRPRADEHPLQAKFKWEMSA